MSRASNRPLAQSKKPKAKPLPARASGRGESPAADASRVQAQWFEEGAARFQARDFRAAREWFEKAATGPVLEMAHAARSYARMCEQRISRSSLSPATTEERYTLAIALINQQRFDEAERHLREALTTSPNGDHLYYALALCRAKRGEIEQAHLDLKRAIELQPKNRALARSDPDFAEFTRQPLFEELLFPDQGRS